AKFYRVSGGSTQHKGVVPDIAMPSMIDTTTIGEDTYASSLPWTTVSPSFFKPTGEVSPALIAELQKKSAVHSAGNPLYQSYLRDLGLLDQIRRKKTVSLQESSFKSESESIKQIEKQWVREPDQKKDSSKDVILNEATSIVSDLAIVSSAQHQSIRP
ncbi:MAG: carboxy terminal-processing peptidase, partial [Chlorobiaceae bacterium]|nr:carboxy terminal-processing peptidase [Chlorobiaceae bacterium]NTV61431.1 carboxy terminal-processing peptidase [Chlorobiaceae bacterium]